MKAKRKPGRVEAMVGHGRDLSLATLMSDLSKDYGHPWPGEDAGTKAHREWMLARITVADRLNQQMTKSLMHLPNTPMKGAGETL